MNKIELVVYILAIILAVALIVYKKTHCEHNGCSHSDHTKVTIVK